MITMKIKSRHQSSCSPSFLKHLIFSLTVFLSIVSPCPTFPFSPTLLFLPVLIMSILAVFFHFTKRKIGISTKESIPINSNKEKTPTQDENKMIAAKEELSISKRECADNFYSSNDSANEEWPLQNYNVDNSIGSSDGSISDEESLIEIALPDGHSMSNSESSYKPLLGINLLDYLPESVLSQHGLMDLFSEINEDDNLIEIDISLGSIKCSPLEIKG